MSYKLGNDNFTCDSCGAKLKTDKSFIPDIEKILGDNKWVVNYVSERGTGTIDITYKGMVNRVTNLADKHVEYNLKCVLCVRKEKLKKICTKLEI